jgi:hypothetical protein
MIEDSALTLIATVGLITVNLLSFITAKYAKGNFA